MKGKCAVCEDSKDYHPWLRRIDLFSYQEHGKPQYVTPHDKIWACQNCGRIGLVEKKPE